MREDTEGLPVVLKVKGGPTLREDLERNLITIEEDGRRDYWDPSRPLSLVKQGEQYNYRWYVRFPVMDSDISTHSDEYILLDLDEGLEIASYLEEEIEWKDKWFMSVRNSEPEASHLSDPRREVIG